MKKIIYISILFLLGTGSFAAGGNYKGDSNFPASTDELQKIEKEYAISHDIDFDSLSLLDQLKARAQSDPFNIIAAIIFLCAIIHTFCATKFMRVAHKLEAKHHQQYNDNSSGVNKKYRYAEDKDPVSFKATCFHFFGEVEAIFALWLIPLLITIFFMKGWATCTAYIDSRNYTEPMFVVVIMAIAGSRPVIAFAESAMSKFANIGKCTPVAWWLSILTVGPLLGSFITEPAAMTICALLLGHQFYHYNPSDKFKYATIGLLFVNVSVGGTLTHFAAPPVLMVAGAWDWDLMFMFSNFGWKAALGIISANIVYFLFFRKEFRELRIKADNQPVNSDDVEESVPAWIILVHLLFLSWTVLTLHHPAMFVGGFLFFLAFTIATDHHQYTIAIKGPLLVGLFLAGLVTHGGLQGWWISPLLSALNEASLFVGSVILTAFNDNAAITFLASQVPDFNSLDASNLRYAVVAGAVTGGGLTVIANAPNPAGQNLLSKYFKGGIAPVKLFFGAFIPTVIMAIFFMLIK